MNDIEYLHSAFEVIKNKNKSSSPQVIPTIFTLFKNKKKSSSIRQLLERDYQLSVLPSDDFTSFIHELYLNPRPQICLITEYNDDLRSNLWQINDFKRKGKHCPIIILGTIDPSKEFYGHNDLITKILPGPFDLSLMINAIATIFREEYSMDFRTVTRECHQKTATFDLPEKGLDLKKFLTELEDSLIQQALQKTHGNKNKASKLLQLNRTTLIEKMKKRGILSF